MLRHFLTIGALLFLVAPCAWGQSFTSEVKISPSDQLEGAYQCRAIVRDAESGDVLFAPSTTFSQGQEAEATSESGDGLQAKLTVLVGEHEATYELVISKAGAPVHSQKATVTLN